MRNKQRINISNIYITKKYLFQMMHKQVLLLNFHCRKLPFLIQIQKNKQKLFQKLIFSMMI